MNLYDWFYKQVVSPGELSTAFEAADDALRGMVTTLGIFGLAVGGDVVPAAPTPSMSVIVKGPVLAYDDQGDRIYLPDANLAVNLSQDENGASTAIYTPQQERYLGVFIKFTRTLADPRTDGDGNEVFFARLEGADVVVAAGAPAPVGTASRAALRDGHVLLADVRIVTSQTQITAQHILTDRTQYLFRATSGTLNIWGRTFPEIVQKVVDRFAQFMVEMQMTFDEFSGASNAALSAFQTQITNLYNSFVGTTNAEVNRLAGLIKSAALDITFVANRAGSGIPSTNVQDAIEHVKATIPGPTSIPTAAQVSWVNPVGWNSDNVQNAIVEAPAYAYRSRGVWTGTHHFREAAAFNRLRLANYLEAVPAPTMEDPDALDYVRRGEDIQYADENGAPHFIRRTNTINLMSGVLLDWASGDPAARLVLQQYWEWAASWSLPAGRLGFPIKLPRGAILRTLSAGFSNPTDSVGTVFCACLGSGADKVNPQLSSAIGVMSSGGGSFPIPARTGAPGDIANHGKFLFDLTTSAVLTVDNAAARYVAVFEGTPGSRLHWVDYGWDDPGSRNG